MPVSFVVVSASAKDSRLTANFSRTVLLTSSLVVPSTTHTAYFGGSTLRDATRIVFAACSSDTP